MATSASIDAQMASVRVPLRAVERRVVTILAGWCAKHSYGFHSRVKTPESLTEKLDSGRYKRWSEVDDLLGCTIVVPTTGHEREVIRYLKWRFAEVELRRRNSTAKFPEVFRFDSTRFIATLRSRDAELLVPGASSIKFEVQVPTVFEHAWSVATHDLVYKSDQLDWQRLRLAAQLKAAVEQIELIIAGFEQQVAFVPASPEPATHAKRHLIEVLKTRMAAGDISAELAPASWSRFADNCYSLLRAQFNRDTPGKLDELAAQLDVEFRASPLTLKSGTLFQAVVGFVAGHAEFGKALARFVVVDSQELRDFHGVTSTRSTFDFAS
jgi:ppGpp synthetase/RelA/SpoT-type nucleotidyltranferase